MKLSAQRKINHIPQLITFSFITIFAFIMLFLYYSFPTDQSLDGYSEIDATIEAIEPYYDNHVEEYINKVYIGYEADGNTYHHISYPNYVFTMNVGDTVKIYINDQDPSDYKVDESGMIIFPIVCGVFFIIGISGLVINIKRLAENRRQEYLEGEE